jgi:hypothetical protein
MNQRISGFLGGMIALGLLPCLPVLGIVLSCTAVQASMENARFALHYKPKFVATKTIPSLCDNPATTTIEPNYSPNWNSDTTTPNPLSCFNYSVSCEPMGAGEVYLVIGKAGTEGVSAVSFGISYSGSSHVGIDPAWVTWTPCADGLQFPNSDGVHGDFPQPGGGIRITWSLAGGCPAATQQVIGTDGAHAVVGVFYVYAYSSDIFRVTPNQNQDGGPELAIANCAGVTTDLLQIWGPQIASTLVGQVGFNQTGWNPCGNGPCDPCPQSAPCVTPITPTTWGKVKAKYRTDQ